MKYNLDTAALRGCIDSYGKDPQIDVAIEEMSELIKALVKDRRNKCEHADVKANFRSAISEEMADVIIMLKQLEMIYGNKDEVQQYIDNKISRQRVRLNRLKNSEKSEQ